MEKQKRKMKKSHEWLMSMLGIFLRGPEKSKTLASGFGSKTMLHQPDQLLSNILTFSNIYLRGHTIRSLLPIYNHNISLNGPHLDFCPFCYTLRNLLLGRSRPVFFLTHATTYRKSSSMDPQPPFPLT